MKRWKIRAYSGKLAAHPKSSFCKSEKGNPVMTPRTTKHIVWERR